MLQGAVNGLGSSIVAAQTAGSKAAQFLSVPLESIGTSMTTYASQNMGAHDLKRVDRGVNTALGIGCVYSVASFLILRVLDVPLISLFLESSEVEIMANARSFIFWNSVFYIPLAVLIIYRYTIQGLGYSGLAMFAGVAEMVARAMVLLVRAALGLLCGMHRQPCGMVLRLFLPHPGVLCSAQAADERACRSADGGLRGTSLKPLPLGEVALRSNDGEGKLTSQEYLHSDRHWLLSERCYRCAFCFSVASLPSQSRSARQLSQRESLWQAGQAHAGRAKFDFIGNSSALLQRFTAA